MPKIHFKTDIHCIGCLTAVTPHLNEAIGENNWEVDLSSPQRILTLKKAESPEKIMKVLEDIGFTSIPIK